MPSLWNKQKKPHKETQKTSMRKPIGKPFAAELPLTFIKRFSKSSFAFFEHNHNTFSTNKESARQYETDTREERTYSFTLDVQHASQTKVIKKNLSTQHISS